MLSQIHLRARNLLLALALQIFSKQLNTGITLVARAKCKLAVRPTQDTDVFINVTAPTDGANSLGVVGELQS